MGNKPRRLEAPSLVAKYDARVNAPPKVPKPKAKRGPNFASIIKKYYDDLGDLSKQYVISEMGIRTAFQILLHAIGKAYGLTLIAEHEIKLSGARRIRPDGTVKDQMNLVRGYWEAKDTSDNLDAEIGKKLQVGYPTTNTIFEDSATAVLYQHGADVPAPVVWTLDCMIRRPV